MKNQADRLLFVVDHAGTILFAMEGAFAAIAGNLDFFGVMVVSFATALGGGVLRDVLIGASRPQAIRDWRYPAEAFATGGAVFILHHFAQQIPAQLLMVLDAAGLALFAVAGTQKALSYAIPPFIATLMGTITGVGGGAIRDILLMLHPRDLARRYLRHSRTRWLRGNGPWTQARPPSNIGCGSRRRRLFCAPCLQRLVSLEPAEGIHALDGSSERDDWCKSIATPRATRIDRNQSLCLPNFFLTSGMNSPMLLMITPTHA
jgi:uncharacterized membrane protein YeiH